MDYEKLYNELMLKFSKLETDLATQTAEVTKLTASNTEFKRVSTEREDKDKVAATKTARDNVTAAFEKAVTDKIITPGQRDQFTKLLNVDDDVAVLAIKTDDIDNLLKESGGKMFTKSKSKEGNEERNEADAGSELTTKAYDIMNSNTGMEFGTAFNRAMKANPELAKEHMANKEHTA